MAVTIDTISQAATSTGVTSQTISHTIGSGSNRALYVFSVCLNSTDFLASGTCSYNGTGLGSPVASATNSSNNMYCWRMTNPPTGTANVVITPSASAFLHTFIISVNGADQTTPEGTPTSTVFTFAASPQNTSVTTASGGLALGMVSRRTTSITFTPTGSDTQAGTTQSAGVSTSAASYEADSTALGWTFSSTGNFTHLVVPVNPVSGPTAYTINIDAGSYSLTGQDVTLTYTPVAGSYSLSLEAGEYLITGSNAYADYVMALSAGSYSITGQDVTFEAGGPMSYSLNLEAGSYTIDGSSVRLRYSGEPVVTTTRSLKRGLGFIGRR